MEEKDIEIRLLEFPTCIRERSGMYVGGIEDASVIFREIIDNSFDESYAFKGCDKIIIDQNYNGYHLIADNGRGLPITFSKDKPDQTQAVVSVTSLHSGSKFESTDVARNGMNGVGSSAVNALSESYILLSRITDQNYDKSIPEVMDLWSNTGPRSKRDLFYIVAFERGIKVFEGADKLENIERMIWKSDYNSLPKGFSTIVLFKPDPTIFDKVTSKVPEKNIQYFLLIQEKFYKKRVSIMVNGVLANENFKPYQFEMIKTIVPADTSKNKTISLYVTFEVDPTLGNKVEGGSVSGLVTESGVHINYVESCFEAALKSEYKISHKYLQNGLKINVILLASDVIFDSQTKSRLKSITKVKVTDFKDVVKEFIKVFRSNKDYWDEHVMKLDMYADSMKSFSAEDKIKKMIESSSGNNLYRSKANLIDGFTDATAPASERMQCELFIVEGKSALSGLKQARPSTRHIGILPLRGKVLNVSECTAEEMLNNKELSVLFSIIGLGLDIHNVTSGCKTPEEAWEKICKHSRYGKIIILTDSDEDGRQIANALLYAFSKFARFLIDFGMVSICEGPIFSQTTTSGIQYFYPTDQTQGDTVFPVGLNPSKPFKRYKGLGALDKENVSDTIFGPSRRLVKVTTEGIDYSMSLVEDIDQRKKLLFESGIISNPWNFTDL